MRIRDEIRLGVGTLLAIQVLTMIAAVALLARMTPAIDQILEENEKSIRAVERMLLALAEPAHEPEQAELRRRHFARALAEAEGNITEPSEEPVLERIAIRQDAALAGDPEALTAIRTELWQLSDINRETMLAANASAKRLGTAGAWALVFLGLIGLVFSIMIMRRARLKLIHPVYELGAVLEACSRGDRHRRFNPASASREFQEVAEVVNVLVAEHFAERERGWEVAAKLDRVALLRLLDGETEATLVCDADGAIAAANDAALEQLGGLAGEQLREVLARVRAGEAVEGVSVEPLAELGSICRLAVQEGEDSGVDWFAGVGSVSRSELDSDSDSNSPVSEEASDEAEDPPLASS
jgi:PAS domain-containing protein